MSRLLLGDFLIGVMRQSAPRVQSFLDTIDDTAAARLMAAAEDGDRGPLLKAMSEQTWGLSPARPTPEVQVQPAGRSPMSFEDRVLNDPNIRRAVDASGAQVPAGDVEALLGAYRGAAPKRGRPSRGGDPVAESIRELSRPVDQVAAESIAGQFDRAIGGDVPTRQMALPMGEALPLEAMRIASEQDGAAALFSPQKGLRNIDGEPAFNEWVRRNMGDSKPRTADDLTFDEVPPRPARAQSPAGGSRAAKVAAAATAGGAAGLGLMLSDDDEPAITSGGEADLVEESRPAPQVAATEARPEPTVAQAPADYSLQARALINRLNDMRRAAGGEVPEAPAMMAEINRLVAMGNQQRRDPGYSYQQADPARDPYQQARDLIAQVNQMYRQGMTPNSPEVQRIMAQVRQLQAQGDAIRNRRAG